MTIANTGAIGVIDTRERILSAAYPLFSRRGFRDVSLEEVLSDASLTEGDFSMHFTSMDELLAAFLEERQRIFIKGVMTAGVESRATTPEGRLLAVFDVLEDWFLSGNFLGTTFASVLLDVGKDHPLGKQAARYLAQIRDVIARAADDAHLVDPGAFALSFHVLVKGAVMAAAEGDLGSARRAQAMAALLIKEHQPAMRAMPVLEVVETEDSGEWLVVDEGWEYGQPATAVIREENDGAYYYPYSPDFSRVGPHPSRDDAFRHFRDESYPELW